MQLWAHRGSGTGPSENTLSAFRQAVQAGFSAVEFDVMLTADGVPMVHHDWVLGRCAQWVAPELSASHQPILFHTLTHQILQSQFHVQGEKIPTLVEAIQFCLQHDLQANVELKAINLTQGRCLAAAVRAQIDALPMVQRRVVQQHWVFSSFQHSCLLPLQGLNVAVLYDAWNPRWIVHADALQAQAVHLGAHVVTPSIVRRIHTTGRQVRVYTVNDADRMTQLNALGVQGVFTDRLNVAEGWV